MQKEIVYLHKLSLIHLFVNGTGCEQPVDGAWLGLTITPNACHGLHAIAA
jgi:hypothetical protein